MGGECVDMSPLGTSAKKRSNVSPKPQEAWIGLLLIGGLEMVTS
jgi:hypothetical protein